MWLIFSLMAPFFFGLVHVLDSYCVEDIFEKAWMGMVTSALASIIVFLPLPYLLPLMNWEMPTIPILLIALGAGALIQFSQGFYFQALEYSEAGIVAAYWNMVPATVPILSIVFFGEQLSFFQYLGIVIVTLASVAFCLIDSNLKARWKSFFLMVAAAIMQSFMFILQEYAFDAMPYLQAFTIITLGLVLAGCTPLLFSKVRNDFKRNSDLLIPAARFFIVIEIFNLIALALSQKAVDLGVPSLVAAVESTIPAYTFVIMLSLLFIAPKFSDPLVKKRLLTKIALVVVMSLGVSTLA